MLPATSDRTAPGAHVLIEARILVGARIRDHTGRRGAFDVGCAGVVCPAGDVRRGLSAAQRLTRSGRGQCSPPPATERLREHTFSLKHVSWSAPSTAQSGAAHLMLAAPVSYVQPATVAPASVLHSASRGAAVHNAARHQRPNGSGSTRSPRSTYPGRRSHPGPHRSAYRIWWRLRCCLCGKIFLLRTWDFPPNRHIFCRRLHYRRHLEGSISGFCLKVYLRSSCPDTQDDTL